MREVDTDALRLVAQSLGVGNPASLVGQVAFDDEVLQQSLDVTRLVRRARCIRPTTGVYTATMVNRHTGTSTETTTVDPYEVGLTAAVNSPQFPSPMPNDLEFYVLGYWAQNLSTTGEFASGQFSIAHPVDHQAFGEPGQAALAVSQLLTAFEQEIAVPLGVALQGFDQGVYYRPATRIRRGADLQFRTTSNGAGNPAYRLNLLVGVFPLAMGQDAIGAH